MSDPASLAAAFEHIARTRMADMALCNPALRVAVCGFRPCGDPAAGSSVGVLLTPWCVNLVLLGPAEPLGADQRRTVEFPSGAYEFMGGFDERCGAFQFCPLISPPDEFTSQAQALEVCEEIMKQLFAVPERLTRRALFTPQPACTS